MLNLATCKQLVEMMDGELRVEQGGVEAGPDAGTLFEFTILAEAMPAPVATAHLTLEAMKVLVVTADATERRVMALQTETWGAIATAATLEEAVALDPGGPPVRHRVDRAPACRRSTVLRSRRRSARFARPEQLPIVLIAAAARGRGGGRRRRQRSDPGDADQAGGAAQAARRDGPGRGSAGGRAAAAAVERVAPGALHVLIADDNALNQNLLKRLVVKLGHNVDVVSNGREAVAAVAQKPYDAVLMDVLMPEMDGLEAAEAICRRWPTGHAAAPHRPDRDGGPGRPGALPEGGVRRLHEQAGPPGGAGRGVQGGRGLADQPCRAA